LPLSLGAASLVTAGSDWFDRLVPKSVGVVLSYVGPLTSLGVLWLLFLAIWPRYNKTGEIPAKRHVDHCKSS